MLQTPAHRFLPWVVTLFALRLFAQSQPFSSTADYKMMLEELHHDPIRPSRMSAGKLLTSLQPIPVAANETATALRLESGIWSLNITKAQWGMSLTNKQTGLAWRVAASQLAKVQRIERQENGWQIQVEVAGSTAPATFDIAVIAPAVIRLSMRAPLSNLQLDFNGAGPFFGLGERFDRVKLDGLKSELHPEDLLGRPGHNWTYIPVPFLFTPRGLGVYLDTALASTFDLSRANEQKFSIQLKQSSADAYFFAGEPKNILSDYTALTGRSPVPPPWTFGVWVCSYQGPQKVLEEARKLRQNKIPASAIWTYDVMGKGDIMGWPLWWTGYYPHPDEFTGQLHALGFKVLTYVHPYLRSVLDPYNLPNALFDEGVRSGLFVLNAQGEPTGPAFEPFVDGNIDFTSAANVNWWERKIRTILLEDNFDGWMEDFGEWVHDTDRFHADVSGREMANLNPLFYHKITYEIARVAKPDVVEFDRSGYAGSQGYTRVVWGGDQFPDWSTDYGLPSVVRAGITAGLSGFSIWGPDIAGNGHSKELWTRWVEFGALTPVMRNHLWDKPEGAVNLWYDSQTLDIFRHYAKLHVSLFPYFYSYAHEAAKTGMPIMRHLLLEYPNDPHVYGSNTEYLLGDKILIAPVIEQGALSRTLYLPQGSWVDYWTGKIIQGGRDVALPAPLDRIPILVRAGSILPLISPNTETLAQDLASNEYRSWTKNITWRIFPASGSTHDSFTLYDNTVGEATQTATKIDVQLKHAPARLHVEAILPAARTPHQVLLAGKPLNKLEGENNKDGWSFDSDSGTIHVTFEARDFNLTIEK